MLRNIAHAVQVDVARRTEAAQPDVVADPAAFTGLERDTHDVFQRALETVFALVTRISFSFTAVSDCGMSLAGTGILPTLVMPLW